MCMMCFTTAPSQASDVSRSGPPKRVGAPPPSKLTANVLLWSDIYEDCTAALALAHAQQRLCRKSKPQAPSSLSMADLSTQLTASTTSSLSLYSLSEAKCLARSHLADAKCITRVVGRSRRQTIDKSTTPIPQPRHHLPLPGQKALLGSQSRSSRACMQS